MALAEQALGIPGNGRNSDACRMHHNNAQHHWEPGNQNYEAARQSRTHSG